MSFLKFKENSKDLHWHRANKDGAPFRGEKTPILKEEEYEQLAEKVSDAKIAVFDTSKPDERIHGRTYQEVLDAISAKWFTLLTPRQYQWSKSKTGKPTMFVYVEWAETYMQLPNSVSRKLNTNISRM